MTAQSTNQLAPSHFDPSNPPQGIRFEACTRIGAFLRQGKGRLKTLSLGCSRMG
eukprot:CAMPEP_0119544276 /NCGR_PEP_ID=MMETSP1344-20130328/54634_1 /TAXON_ID=236787 /ORGANISM="Florenciella parvula, Strain CCMP2471" /LENGTH=53 /DNA_ID=CAMNT_0007588747 /DNA_START=111 /DNA_END=268 /DNA_ORIENTATION=+